MSKPLIHSQANIKTKAAFTLIELSIVMVVIGLLVGSILIGQHLIHAAQLNAVSTEANRFGVAIMTFRDKYEAMPGDMKNATEYWGAADGGDGFGSDCGDVESETVTCNGNGDQIIPVTIENEMWEKMRAWQHLSNAGLITGSYTGAPTAGVAYVGKQWPASRFEPAGYEYSNILIGIYRNPPSQIIKIATSLASSATGLNGGFLTPKDAVDLDQKMDDGLSDSGKLVAIDSSDVAGCVTNGVAYTETTYGSYMVENDSKSCRFYFYLGF